MVAKSEINLFNRVKILTLKEEGFSQREIAEKLQVSNLPGRGRKTCTSARKTKHIVLLSKSNRKLTAPEIREDINSTREDPISTSTVQ